MFYVNVYEIHRNDGGPEEGGWSFESGDPVLSVKVPGTHNMIVDRDYHHFNNDENDNPYPKYPLDEREIAVLATVDKLRSALEEAYPRTGYSSSVVPRGGDWTVRVEDHEGRSYPEDAPRYE